MDGTKRWPSDKANHNCENVLSTIVYHSVKGFLIECFTFLALLDIKAFGHLSLITINAAPDWSRTLLQPGCFCLGYHCFL